MRRLMAITAFALFLSVPVWAQHGGGGHGGGGGHAGGFGGGHAGGFSSHAGYSGSGHSSVSQSSVGRSSGGSESGFGAHSYSGPLSQASPHALSSAPSARFSNSRSLTARAGYSRGAFQNGFRSNGFRNGFGNSRFRNGCYGYPCRYGYGYGYGWPWGWYAGYYDPYWWWDSDSNYDQDYYDNAALADQMNQQNLQDQQMLQQEQADGDQDAYANPAPAAAPEKQGNAFLPPTVLVFHDQHKKEVDNYAIVGQTLWAFAPQHTEKIALADLDIPATVKANDDRGITFRVPSANEAQ